MEKRIVSDSKLCVRADEGDGRVIEGYAAVFQTPTNAISENGKVFVEHVSREVMDEALSRPDLNVIHNRDHDDKKILARSRSNTLTLTTDEYGLKYRFSAPKTQLGDETLELVGRGDLFESSYRFTVKPSDINWWRDSSGMLHREILRIAKLKDTSIVVNGAHKGTSVSTESMRSLQDFEAQEKAEELARQEELNNYISNLKQRVNDVS